MRRLAWFWKRVCLLLWSLLNTLRLLDRYWNRVCLLLWSLIVEQLTLTDHMLKVLIGWIHHTRDDQLNECHCGMPPCLTQSVHFHHVVLLSSGHFASGWSFTLLASMFFFKTFLWRVSKSFWWLHLIWILDGVDLFSISFKYIFSNSIVY